MEVVLAVVLVCAVSAASFGPLADVVAPSKERPQLTNLLSTPFERSLPRAKVVAFVRSKVLDDGGYAIIDEVTRREAALQVARDKNPGDKTESAYHGLKFRLRLALAFGRIGVAKRMASPATKSYAVQAMESGIDAMRDAAKELEIVEKKTPPKANEVKSAQLWDFHRRLLAIWDRAKTSDDTGLIARVDIKELAKECLGGGQGSGVGGK